MRVPGPARRYESRTLDFALGTWSQAVPRTARGAAPGGGGASIESPAEAIAAQLHHPLGAAGHGRPPVPGSAGGSPAIDGQPAYVLVLSGPGGPPARVWISRSSWLPVQSASPGVSVSYEWTAQGTIRAASLWPLGPAGLVRVPAE